MKPGSIIPNDHFLSRQRRRTVRIALMTAAAVLALAAIPLWLTMAKSREVLAKFQATSDASFSLSHTEDFSESRGQILHPGSRLKLESGRLEAKFYNGTRNAESLHPTNRKYQTFVSDDFQATAQSSRLRIESTTTGTTMRLLSTLGDLVAGENYTYRLSMLRQSGTFMFVTLENFSLEGTITPIPEPSSTALLGLGLLSLALRRRR